MPPSGDVGSTDPSAYRAASARPTFGSNADGEFLKLELLKEVTINDWFLQPSPVVYIVI